MNKYSINIFWSDEDEGYIAVSPEFPGLSAFGKTAAKAIAEAQIALELFTETYREEGLSLPEPQVVQQYSGQTRLRLPKSLHRQAAQIAEAEGVSLNQLIVDAVNTRVTGTQVAQHLLAEVRTLIQAHNKDSQVALAWSRTAIREQIVTTKTERTVYIPGLDLEKGGSKGN
jgi:antitoxin HicB